MRALLSQFSVSWINGIGYQFLIVTALRTQQSIQKRRLPPGFLIDISGYFRSLMGASGYLVLVEFSGIIRSVEFNRFLRYRVDIGRNLRLNRFFKFQFRVKAVYYRAFLFIIGGGKQKLKVILINNYLIQLHLGLSKDYWVT